MQDKDYNKDKEWGLYVANGLTLIRSAIALGLAARVAVSSDNIDGVMGIGVLIGVATDILDGNIAVDTGNSNELGAWRDSMADISFYSLPFLATIKILIDYGGNMESLLLSSLMLSMYFLFFSLRSNQQYEGIFD